ncbi:hypothetical protein EYF80_048266 [Liparis tanakae]|uniref:Uncharacterized protein n=1 Tax=Liparis tanakae TaxID=230148 RepID=A0A4Z2FMM4_9TELE|nr:hypothetical protein EYF80_048266 [Liparis tanakae]
MSSDWLPVTCDLCCFAETKQPGSGLCKPGTIALFGNVVYSGLLNEHFWHLGVPLVTRLGPPGEGWASTVRAVCLLHRAGPFKTWFLSDRSPPPVSSLGLHLFTVRLEQTLYSLCPAAQPVAFPDNSQLADRRDEGNANMCPLTHPDRTPVIRTQHTGAQ